MARKARLRETTLPHHIMSKCIKELDLFNKDEDKEYYLELIKQAAKIYQIEILAYCLMDNHIHLLVHPRGGDISKFMRKINNPYAIEYNKKYDRSGHLFASRFENIIIRDLNHLLRTSTYIHNNAKDLLYKGYESIKAYPYSSINDYVDIEKGRGIASRTFVFEQMGGPEERAYKHYLSLLEIQMNEHEAFEEEMKRAFKSSEYISDKESFDRNESAPRVISVLERLLKVEGEHVLHTKYVKRYRKFKGIVAATLRIYCDISLAEMCQYFKGQTSVTIGKLAMLGIEEFDMNPLLFTQIKDALLT